MNIQGIIFDCDGTLVDSERLAAQLLSQLLGEQDVEMTPADVLLRFRGVQFQSFVDGLCDLYPALSPETLTVGFRTRSLPLFEGRLEPMPGAIEFVESLRIPACVASNGPRIKIETCLKSVGLYSAFENTIISAYEVQAWKPDPKIMLHAAESLGLPTDKCLVVEDSLSGVEAGLLAGCLVAGYGDADFSKFSGQTNFHPCPDYNALDQLLGKV
ncbi:HAD family hydrolase [Pseudomonas sp. s4]|uniref:HAD family hydrolase n=1 Tax=Pseudomonas sp. s4 TaxID=353218 RepID=UPI00398CAD77